MTPEEGGNLEVHSSPQWPAAHSDTVLGQRNMLLPGCLIWILIPSLGFAAGGERTLPHVMKFQTVTPQRLKDSSQPAEADATQTYPDSLQYSLAIGGKERTLQLQKNKDLLRQDFTVTHFAEQGTQLTSTPDHQAHCYYHGHVVGLEDSSVSVELCSGIKGFVHLQGQTYLIEPLREDSRVSETGEALHAVYNYKHLRLKRSSCSHGNTTTFYDHGARSSGMFRLSSLRSRPQTKEHKTKSRTVELAVVVDNSEYKKFGSRKAIEARVLEIANHVDKLYRPVGVRVMLVSLDVWSYSDQITVSTNPEETLTRFLEWRQRNLVPRTKHDNAQFITGLDFDGSTVGLANTNAMCTSSSGAVNEDHNNNAVGVSATIAHEMGHNLGLSHDTENCVCGSVISKRGCIMAESVGTVYPELFSSCSLQQLSRFLEEVNPACLLDSPSTERIFGGPMCGNAFLESGEECDCGTVEECKNKCCNASTCRLNEGAQCADGECCHNCQLKATGSVCRPKAGDCDLAEYCTGLSASCPADAYTQNGLSCNRGRGYCYNGQCPSRQQHCKRLWGPDADVAVDACYSRYGSCRNKLFSQRCSIQDQSCGTLYCSGGWEFPVTSRKSFYQLGSNVCNEATMNPADNYPADFGLVPTGTRCGNNMVCFNQKCQDMSTIRAYGSNDCSAKCHNHGVCDHESRCHCDPGWAPPYCDVQQSEIAAGAGAVFIVSLAVGLLTLMVLIVGSLMCFVRKHKPAKRCLQSTSGQSNPLFHSSGPRLGSTAISQPTFVESSHTQVCKPLTPASVRSSGRAFKPSRAAPEPPLKAPPLSQPSFMKQALKPPVSLPAAASKPICSEAMPRPPSKPLPPLTKTPKPPMPPVKPKPSAGPLPLPHTTLAGRAALMPPSRPR
ncbi:disintegrin and metalloproteinase domain-containing protein 8a [Synchiropus splendidus]|uniref:disintegrin and metalloproteinase domain-containing protein 8a n=1 Tax=Synchiropus splendidus TaxID=270530 RepID=UPI00237EC492|nr:disintegrin and metalloproteinase domain-containing protein 8a [Synchiropus splendidus]